MRICFFAPANSSHTQKWCTWFSERGHEVHVVSFDNGEIDGVIIHSLGANANASGRDLQKLRYFFATKKLRKTIDSIAPDVLSVHYATSYGATAALAGIKPYFLSVWGSDIYAFPRKSIFHRLLLKFSLRKADYLLSTSHAMAEEAGRYTNREFFITPFGVDVKLFSPEKRNREDKDFVLGTIKGLNEKYGIDYLLKAVALVRTQHPELPLKLRIAGKGEKEQEYKQLAETLGISDITTWLGYISQEQAAQEWANMDLAVIASTAMESFGVSAVEAQACGVPVIVSDVPGLMEATSPGESSLVVPRKNEKELAESIFELYSNAEKRKYMGRLGIEFVNKNYSLDVCFKRVEDLFIKQL